MLQERKKPHQAAADAEAEGRGRGRVTEAGGNTYLLLPPAEESGQDEESVVVSRAATVSLRLSSTFWFHSATF